MFYDAFVKLCVAKGMSPSAVAAAVGMAGAHVTRWKRGSTPTDATISKIAAYFDVPVSYFKEEEKKKGSPFIANSKPVDFDIQIDDGLTDKQRDLINLVAELPDNVVSLFLSAAKDWLKNQQSSDSV